MPSGLKKKRPKASGVRARVVAIGPRRHPVRLANLFDILSELLAMEKHGILLFDQAKNRVRPGELRHSLDRFLKQSQRHADLLQTAIRDLGGNPVYLSPGAQVQDQRFRVLSELSVPSEDQTVSDIENILVEETRSGFYLEFLGSIQPFLEHPHAKDVVAELLDDVREEKISRLRWAETSLRELLAQRALRPPVDYDMSYELAS